MPNRRLTPEHDSDETIRAAPNRQPQAGVRLLWEADGLLDLVPQLRATGFVSDLPRLREKIAAMLLDFRTHARASGIEASRAAQATEVLAALIDHVVTSMPWGAEADWQALAASKTPPGAQRARQPLVDIARASSSDAGMRELIGVALALGFEGRGRDSEDPQIDQLRAQLMQGVPAEQVLSPQSQSAVERGKALTRWLPLWVLTLVIAALLAVLFVAAELSLGAKSDRLYARMAGLNGPTALASRPLPAPQARLAGALAGEATAQSLSVHDEIDRSVIVVPGARLFEPGNATLRPASSDLLRPIAAALQLAPGRIRIIGHTDGRVARAARYPSDWELSVDRARAVQDALRELGIETSRTTYDGRAGIEPLKADDPARAPGADGRVEIVLLAGR